VVSLTPQAIAKLLHVENPIAENFQSYYFFLRLNIRTLFMLLQLLQSELAGPNEGDDTPDVTGQNRQSSNEGITAVTRRVLASVRQYSIWLVSSAVIISGQGDDSPLDIHIKELWSIYCSTLSLLVTAFPPERLPSIDYLLEEDADTVGFLPLRHTTYCDPYTNERGLKPRTTDLGIERQHPNIEMLSRIRDLLRDATILSTQSDKNNQKIAPIRLVRGEFQFLEAGLPLSNSENESSSEQSASRSSAPQFSIPRVLASTREIEEDRAFSVSASDSHQSMSTDMYQMVDDLVAPSVVPRSTFPNSTEETSYGMHNTTAAEVFGQMDSSARPASRHSATPFAGPPGLFKTPFSPQPGELSATSSERPNTAVRLSSLQLSDTRSKLAAAAALDENTGQVDRSNWNTVIPPPRYLQQTSQQQFSQQLHNPIDNQYCTPSSSLFSQSSSVYAGTPYVGQNVPNIYGDHSRDLSGNMSTRHAGAKDFDRSAMLQSSFWNGSQPAGWTNHVPTPPGGQGG
jgi:hypothetical protein